MDPIHFGAISARFPQPPTSNGQDMISYFTDIEDGDTAAITTAGPDLIATSESGTSEPVSQSYVDTYLRPATADEVTAYLAAAEQGR